MASADLGGVIPVVSTPFSAGDEIDVDALGAEVDWLIGCGVDGLAIAMVSEVLRLSDTERRRQAEVVTAAVAGRVPVVASVGAQSTKETVSLARYAQSVGAAAVMAIPPLLVELPDEEIFDFFRSVLVSVDLPLIVQDASGYLGRPLSLQVCARLLDTFGALRVQFKPEASPIGPRLSALLAGTGGRARVFEGTGGVALVDSYRRGIVGSMPGPEVPWAVVALWRALERGDWAAVGAIHGPLAAMVSLQTSLDSFIAVEKYLLVRQGVFTGSLRRRPNAYELDRETAVELDRLLALLHDAVVTGTTEGPATEGSAAPSGSDDSPVPHPPDQLAR